MGSEKSSKTVALHTLGCRLNFSETAEIAEGFAKRGYKVIPFGEPADLTFINTCTVTDSADSTCRNIIRKAHRISPEGQLVVSGCYAQMDADTVEKITGVDLVLGTSQKYRVFDFLDETEEQKIHIDKSNEFWGASSSLEDSHTRAFLKIQDGCNYICSFCIIPFARGRSRTLSVQRAVEEAKKLIKNGFKEIVLTGVNIGEYESTQGEKLSDLINRVASLEGLERLRLSSVEPNTFNNELLDVMQSHKNFMPHFHVPLQSGSDTILKKMRRKYTAEEYSSVLKKIKSRFPNAAIGADMIVGSPGESEVLFKESYEFIKTQPITHFHVFPYSRRKNTTAAKDPEQIPYRSKKERVQKLIDLGRKKLSAFAQDKIGKTDEVLVEASPRSENSAYVKGYTKDFIRVQLVNTPDLGPNQIIPVKIKEWNNGALLAEIN